MNVLVRATNWVGDAVMSIPALRAIRAARPGAEITVLARPWVAELYAREDFADSVLVYDTRSKHAGIRGRFRLAAELRGRRFDCAILLPNSFDAAFLAWQAKIPRRIGYARDGRSVLLTDAIPPPRPGAIPPHQRYYYLELLRRAGLLATLPEFPEIRLHGDAAAGRELLRHFGLRGERIIGVSPGAAFGSAKRWLPERFAAAASDLAAEWDAEVAVFGTASEAQLCGAVAQAVGPPARSLAGRTSLGQFIDLAAACLAFLTNDSGAMHIASAVGVPTVAVFGATDPAATGPTASLARIVRTPVECSPCLLRECPIDHRCMTRVEAAAVAGETRRLVALAARAQEVPAHGHAQQDR
ncbi:MAG TPA: lipopolysaccharide heptosyltransferase II [Bryobacterales bacterium]|nr:lipopolysaccharide heptosyltransferase II [Bryobacterales bacterium]